MTKTRTLLIFVSVLLAFTTQSAAQVGSLSPEDERAHRAEADLWLNTVFGYCLARVAGKSWSDHPAELRGEWDNLRPDYASTLIAPLYDPKVSASRGAVILDLNSEGDSCWTQYTSLVPDYAASEFGAIRDALAREDRLKTAFVDQGYGPQQVEVILAGETRAPVIFYQTQGEQEGAMTVVTILQKTVPDFVYVD